MDTPWYLALVNRWNPLPEDYEVDLVEVPGGEKVDERIYDPLMEMLDAAEAEDLGPIVVSGFRTEENSRACTMTRSGSTGSRATPRRRPLSWRSSGSPGRVPANISWGWLWTSTVRSMIFTSGWRKTAGSTALSSAIRPTRPTSPAWRGGVALPLCGKGGRTGDL